MSYILDALRRADAERQRGAVPDLNAQPAAAPPVEHEPALRLGPAGLAAAALVALAAAAALAWWWAAPPTPTPTGAGAGAAPPPAAIAQVAAPPAQPRTAADAAAPGSTALPAPAAPPQAGLAAQARPVNPLSPPAQQVPATPGAVPSAPGLRVPVSRPRPVQPPVPPATGPAPAPADTAASDLPVRVPRLAELPEAMRRELSALRLGGSVYADQAAMRMVIVNGQVFHEGDRPLPELQVQRIGLKSVVFSLRGQRFEMPL